MPLSESDTRAKLIDPAIHARGWTEDLIRREETAGGVEIVDGRPRRQPKGFIDYTLRVKVNDETQPVAVALIEAKGREVTEALATLRRPSQVCALRRQGETHVSSAPGREWVRKTDLEPIRFK